MNANLGVPLQLRFRMYAALNKRATPRKTKADRVVEKHEGSLASAIHKALVHQAQTIARQVSHRYAAHMHKTQPQWAQDLIDEVDTEGVGIAVRDAVNETMQETFRRAGLTALSEVDVDISGEALQHMDEMALAYVKERGAELVTSISDTTRDTLRDLVSDGIEEGWGAQTLASEITDSVAFSADRAMMISRTELAFGHAQGNLAGYKTGGVERKQWLASEGACEICVGLDGVIVDIDDDFDADGEAIDAPPAHPNCRCDVLPVLEETA